MIASNMSQLVLCRNTLVGARPRLPAYLIRRLQTVHNAAARFITDALED